MIIHGSETMLIEWNVGGGGDRVKRNGSQDSGRRRGQLHRRRKRDIAVILAHNAKTSIHYIILVAFPLYLSPVRRTSAKQLDPRASRLEGTAVVSPFPPKTRERLRLKPFGLSLLTPHGLHGIRVSASLSPLVDDTSSWRTDEDVIGDWTDGDDGEMSNVK